MVPGASPVGTLFAALAKLQLGTLRSNNQFKWYVEKITQPYQEPFGTRILQGVRWTLPKSAFELLGGKITGSLAATFVPVQRQSVGVVGAPNGRCGLGTCCGALRCCRLPQQIILRSRTNDSGDTSELVHHHDRPGRSPRSPCFANGPRTRRLNQETRRCKENCRRECATPGTHLSEERSARPSHSDGRKLRPECFLAAQ